MCDDRRLISMWMWIGEHVSSDNFFFFPHTVDYGYETIPFENGAVAYNVPRNIIFKCEIISFSPTNSITLHAFVFFSPMAKKDFVTKIDGYLDSAEARGDQSLHWQEDTWHGSYLKDFDFFVTCCRRAIIMIAVDNYQLLHPSSK